MYFMYIICGDNAELKALEQMNVNCKFSQAKVTK